MLLACSILVTLELLTGYIGDVPLIGMISVFLPLLQNVVFLGEKGRFSGSNMPFFVINLFFSTNRRWFPFLYDSLRCINFTLKDDGDALRCKNFTSNKRGGNRYLPFAFTREGIAMMSFTFKVHFLHLK